MGNNTEAPLAWRNLPRGTNSLVLIGKDTTPDRTLVPEGDYVHEVIYNIPASTREIRGTANGGLEGRDRLGNITFSIPPRPSSADAAGATGPRLGVDGSNRLGYNGPNPPDGLPHTYVWTLYALSGNIQLQPGARGTAAEVESAMQQVNPATNQPYIIGQTSIQ